MYLTTSKKIQRMSGISYASTIGCLVYAMLCTWTNIIFSISVTRRYQSNPDEEHWIPVKNILKYLRRTKDLFLIFGGGSELRIEGYTDSNFMSDPDDRKSTSESVFVCWKMCPKINCQSVDSYAIWCNCIWINY